MSGKNQEKSGNLELDDMWQPCLLYHSCFICFPVLNDAAKKWLCLLLEINP